MTREGRAATREQQAAPREDTATREQRVATGEERSARGEGQVRERDADPAGGATGQGQGSTSHPVPGGERGATRLSEHAHHRVAAGAAGEALRATAPGAPGGLPRAAVRIRRGGARIKIGVVLPCPSDLGKAEAAASAAAGVTAGTARDA